MATAWIAELRRRHVPRVAGVYAVSAFAAIQAADLLFPRLGVPDWGAQLVLGLAIVGFPIAITLAWAYDLTPAGMQRTQPKRRRRPPAPAPHTPAPPAPTVTSDGRRGVAVLPFANLSADPEQGFFSDGVTEDILTHLSRVASLRVVSRTSVMRYRGTTKSVREIAGELSVEAILEGSVRIAAGRVRVVAQLIDAATDAHLWAETYDRRLDDVFEVQSEVAESVARALAAQLTNAEIAGIRRPPTTDIQAYALCLEGYAALETWSIEDLTRAIANFEAALRIDPDYARAHAGLGLTLAIYPAFSGSMPPQHERLPHAVARALELDANSGHAHVANGFGLWILHRDWIGAERAIRHAIELDPEDVHVLILAAFFYTILGRRAEATRLCERANAVRATSAADSMRACVEYYAAALGSGDFRLPLRLLDAVITREPALLLGHLHRGFCLIIAERFEEALETFDTVLRLAPDTPLGHACRGACLIRLGRADEASAHERWFEDHDREGTADRYAWAILTMSRGEIDAGFDHLERAVAEHHVLVPFIRSQPRYRPLWPHPRFQALMESLWPGEQKSVIGELGWSPAATA